MPFEPDIIVTGPDSSDVALVVEVKSSSQRLEDSERQLKAYMTSLRSPIGLLVTRERLQLYRDKYLPSAAESITKVGDFALNSIPQFRPAVDELEFERSVQSWLEGLSTDTGLRGLPADFKRAAQTYIVPALEQGVVRSGHPRSNARS